MPVPAMIYVHLWKEKSRIYGFLIWPNLHYMLQSLSNAASLEGERERERGWKLSSTISVVSSFLFFLSLTYQLYHILSLLGFFSSPFLHTFIHKNSSTYTQVRVHTHTHMHARALNAPNHTHAGAPRAQTHTCTESCSAPRQHLRFSRTNFLTLFSFFILRVFSFLSLAASLCTSALNHLHI